MAGITVVCFRVFLFISCISYCLSIYEHHLLHKSIDLLLGVAQCSVQISVICYRNLLLGRLNYALGGITAPLIEITLHSALYFEFYHTEAIIFMYKYISSPSIKILCQ
ncbi:hypothetical protein EDD22DRAFT_397521 [Suillus occidentalis]|nr:hypothetical protein EDD22DRAFT_397521 [Suillus occidentalis]